MCDTFACNCSPSACLSTSRRLAPFCTDQGKLNGKFVRFFRVFLAHQSRLEHFFYLGFSPFSSLSRKVSRRVGAPRIHRSLSYLRDLLACFPLQSICNTPILRRPAEIMERGRSWPCRCYYELYLPFCPPKN